MAEKPIQIFKETPEHESMDFFFLKEEGMQMVQELSGKIWTDYNPHDPGVTILEQLCYALADLGFRTDFKIQDIINARLRKHHKDENSTFFDASEILPSNPINLLDYRKLIIDSISAVKNAWIEPVLDNLQGIKGLYRILLQIDEAARNEESIERIKSEVFALFNEHRNLCEDIESIEVLAVNKIVIYAEIDINSESVAEEVLAEILFKLEEHFMPSIPYYTIEELLEEGYPIEEIFDGPAPVHGIIKKEDLRPLRQEIYISKLIEIISSIEGVRRINYFNVEKDEFQVDGDVIRIDERTYPVLLMDTIDERWNKNAYPLQFKRGALQYDLDLNTANQLLYSLYAQYKKGYQVKLLYNDRDYPSVLNQEGLSKYFSVQNTFPATYGLSRYGLPNNVKATREREAMIKQLKGYLLFFEQIMSNYLAQLSHVKDLFSLDESLDKTYFSQPPIDGDSDNLDEKKKDELRFLELVYAKDINDFQQKLDGVMAQFDPYSRRRNRILDHLLARFGEQFTTDFLVKVSNYVGLAGEENDPEKELIQSKINFLKHYVDISRNRSRGFNYLALHQVIQEQELEWANLFEKLLKQFEDEEEKQVIRNQFLQLRMNYSARQHQADFFSMVLTYKSPEDIVLRQDNELLQGIDLPELVEEEFKAINLNFVKKAKKVLHEEVAGLEKRICMLLNISLHGNESLIQAFESAADTKVEEELEDILTYTSADLPEGYLDLDAEMLRVSKKNESKDEEDADDFEPIDQDVDDTLDYFSRFVFRADNLNDLFTDLLSNAVFAHNFVVLPRRKNGEEVFAIYYRGNPEIGAVKVREQNTRLAARYEIERLLKFLGQINKYTEGMHLVEHVLLRGQAQDRHGFRLVNDQERVLLESQELGSLQEQRFLSDQLPLVAAKIENYVVEPQLDGTYRVLLKDYDKVIAYCPDIFYTPEGAKEKIEDIIDYVYSFKNSDISLFNNIQFFLEERRDAPVESDFYSLSMSVMLPAWPSRFQNEDFRALFCNLFVLNAPAHLDIHFYWLGIDEMKAFEQNYFDWLEERNSLTPSQPALDDKAHSVVEVMQKIKTELK